MRNTVASPPRKTNPNDFSRRFCRSTRDKRSNMLGNSDFSLSILFLAFLFSTQRSTRYNDRKFLFMCRHREHKNWPRMRPLRVKSWPTYFPTSNSSFFLLSRSLLHEKVQQGKPVLAMMWNQKM